MGEKRKIAFDFEEINIYNAWLLGFIFADAGIYYQRDTRIIKLYNKDKLLLEKIKLIYNLPYKVVEQKNTKNILYFIRISNPEFIDSIVKYGFEKNKDRLRMPKMSKRCEKVFLSGFIQGKGSLFEEEKSNNYGIKIVYRSEMLIEDIVKSLNKNYDSKHVNPYCRRIKNEISCCIKYVGKECDNIERKAKKYSILRNSII